MTAAACLAGKLLGLALAGWAIAGTWRAAGLPRGAFEPGLLGHPPDPEAWPRLFAVWVPLLYLGFEAAHRALGRPETPPSRLDRLRAASWLGLPAFVLLELVVAGTARPRVWLGAAYLFLVAVQAVLLVRRLSPVVTAAPAATAREAPARTRVAGLHLALAAFLVYAPVAAYLDVAVSTTGDEPYYLLVSLSLLREGDLDLADNFAREDYRPFYWGRLYRGQNTVETPGGRLYSVTYSGLLAWLLLPGVAVGGRLGAMLTMAAATAALMAMVFRLAAEATGSRRAAFAAWVGLAFVPPVLVFSAQLYPEVPAALLLAGAIAAAERLPDRPGRRLTGLAACLAALVLLKARYMSLALVLLAWAGWRLRRWRWTLPALAAVALAALALAGLDQLLGGLLYARYLGRISADVVLRPAPHMLLALLGFALDQEFGLLPYAPLYAFAAPGVVLALRRRPAFGWPVAALVLYAYPFLHSYEWYGGFSPPFRYLVVSIPILGIAVAHALAAVRGPALAALALGAGAWGLGVAVLLTVAPGLRYHHATGQAGWLRLLGRWLDADLTRFAPTLVTHSAETPWVLSLLGLLLLVGAVWGARAVVHRPERSPELPPGTVPRAAAALLVLATALAAAGRLLPTREIQGEQMEATGRAVLFPGSPELPFKAVVFRGSGRLAAIVRLAPGPARLLLHAGGYTTEAEPPRLEVALDGVPLAELSVTAGRGTWQVGVYTVPFEAPGGRHRLTLSFPNGLDQVAAGRVRHLLVDRIRIEQAR